MCSWHRHLKTLAVNMDPLSVIREAITSKQAIRTADGGNYVIGSNRLDGRIETCFKKGIKSSNPYYSVSDVIFFWENKDLASLVYRKKATEEGFTGVVERDRAKLCDYLSGVVDAVDSIDQAKQKAQRKASSATSATNGDGAAGTVAGADDLDNPSSSAADVASELRRVELLKIAQDLHKLHEQSPDNEDLFANFMEADKEYLKHVFKDSVPAFTRTTIMERPQSDFTFALELMKRVMREREANAPGKGKTVASSSAGGPAKRPRNSTSGSTAKLQVAPGFTSRSRGPPIIIVPNSLTSTISGLNVRDFLEDGKYIPVAQKKKEGFKRIASQTMRLKLGASAQDVCVTDNPSSIKKADWDRVVAVFVVGQDWQFRPMMWDNPVDLFQNVLGIHVTQDDSDLSKLPVGKWRCEVIRINSSRRHMDAVASGQVLKLIANHTRVSRPWLVQA